MVGGKRDGAGRKSQWRSPTKMMRLPAQYEAEIMKYAKRLDSEAESQRCIEVNDLDRAIARSLAMLPPSSLPDAANYFKALKAELLEQA